MSAPKHDSLILSILLACSTAATSLVAPARAADDAAVPLVRNVEGQPLAANITRLLQAYEFLGAPLEPKTSEELREAAKARDVEKLQQLLDPHVLALVSLNPEVRVKAARGPAKAVLQQHGFTPCLIKIFNDSTVTKRLRVASPQAGPVYAGTALNSLERQQQTELKENENVDGATDRFLEVEVFEAPPMTPHLSGLTVEYMLLLVYSSEAGKREATLAFDVGAGTQDLGFRAEVPILFEVRPAVPVKLTIRDFDGRPTTARLTFRDALGKVYPPQAKRLAPDFFFQPQIYRADGQTVFLPPGTFALESTRGPEYRIRKQQVSVPDKGPATIEVQLERWINPMQYGYFVGDHHIHGAGCSHYDNPTQGVTPEDMFQQVKGEGLNVGCVLTWGPCFDFQRQYFAPQAHQVSEPLTILKYDLEISGFGSQALGHVCLLNLKNQTYPGSDGTKTKGWPTWTTPVLRWAKAQGGITGYPHSAMHVDPESAARRLLKQLDENGDERLDEQEAARGLLPEPFAQADADGDRFLRQIELQQSANRAADHLPNLAIPATNGGGALEICVSTAMGACDFVSAMDTARIPEWNTWYHLMNCGFPLKLSGETDFPCMSSRWVGQGRVYVQLGKATQAIDFPEWCRGIAAGRSYVSDGFAHAVEFTVDGLRAGEGKIELNEPQAVTVRAKVSFAKEVPKGVAYGHVTPAAGARMLGDTVLLHGPRPSEMLVGGERLVEVVVNGQSVAQKKIPADGKLHDVEFDVQIDRSSWVALRQFPELHTNPVDVIVGGKPVRASGNSARWCAEVIDCLWENRASRISEAERDEAYRTFQEAIGVYRRIADESPPGS